VCLPNFRRVYYFGDERRWDGRDGFSSPPTEREGEKPAAVNTCGLDPAVMVAVVAVVAVKAHV
jgi:hypothetical protein